MFASKQRGTVIAEGLKIVGIVTAEGLVEVNGQIEGELHCTSLVIARNAHVTGTIQAEQVVVDGKVEGPIQGRDVLLKSQAHVVGDIHHQSLAIERGAFFDGRSVQIRGNGQTPAKLERKSARQTANRETPRIERAEPVEGELVESGDGDLLTRVPASLCCQSDQTPGQDTTASVHLPQIHFRCS
jgi:cytoskeletal protein CcmA (bactofilin family)